MSLYSDIFSSLGPSRHQEGMILAASQRTTIRLETTFVRSMPLWLEGAPQKCWPFMRQLVSLKWRFQLTRLTQMLAGSLIASARMLWQTLAVAERPPNTILPPVMRPVRMNSLSGDSEHPEELLYSGHIDSGLEVLESVLKQVNLRIPGTGMRLLPEVLLGRLKLRIRGLGWRERGGAEYERKDLIRIDAYMRLGSRRTRACRCHARSGAAVNRIVAGAQSRGTSTYRACSCSRGGLPCCCRGESAARGHETA